MSLDGKIVYLDHAATTSPLKEVVSIYSDALERYFYNPSSVHLLGSESKRALDSARDDILNAIHCFNHDVIYTSGATEANNLAIKGFAHRNMKRGKHIISTCIEHSSVLNTLKSLEQEGFEITYLSVDSLGQINIEELKSSIRKDTILISIMAVNNEIGTIENIKGVVDVIKDNPQIKLHVDAVQAIGKIKLPYSDIDLITVALHKIGGLKSSGLLIKRRNIELIPIIDGGGQEFGLRSGTNDTPLALASAYAFKNAIAHIDDHYNYVKELVKPIYDYLNNNKDLYELNSAIDFPYIINFSTITKKASVVTEALSNKNIMVASKSACSSKLSSASHVVKAIGKNDNVANNTIRLSFSVTNTSEEIKYFIETLDKIIYEVRS